MYQQNFNQQQLPVPATNVAGGFLQITYDNPPFVPQYNGPDYLLPAVRFISAAVAMEIQNSCNLNSGRVFMFNLYSQNGFCNEYFANLVTLVLDSAAMAIQNGANGNPGDIAANQVSPIIRIECAALAQRFPALQQYIPNELNQNMINGINEYNNLINALSNFKAGMMNQQVSHMGYQDNRRLNQNIPAYQGVNQQRPVPGINATSNLGTSNNSGVFNKSRSFNYNEKQGNETGRFSPTEYNATALEKSGTKNELTPITELELDPFRKISIRDIPWVSTENVAYFYAFNPLTHNGFYIVDKNNRILEQRIEDRTESIMDYERHSLVSVYNASKDLDGKNIPASSFGSIPDNLDVSQFRETINDISEGVKALSEATNLYREANSGDEIVSDPEIVSFIKSETIVEESLHLAWLEMGVDRLCSEKIPYLYRAYARIGTPFLSNVDETDIIKNYGSAKTYIELREKIRSSVNEVNPELWRFSNIIITDSVNRVLKQNLSLSTSIDSFIDDIQDLINILKSKYGDSVHDAFMKHQRNIIGTTFLTMFDGSADELTATFLDGKTFNECSIPKITYVSCDYTLTYINCLVYELGIELAPNVSSAITETLTPTMYKLLNSLFNSTHQSFSIYNRHLIKTNDGRILEATKGFLGDDVYLLTLID